MGISIASYIEEKFGDALEECAEEYYESPHDWLEKRAWNLHVLGEVRVENTRVHRVIPKLRSSSCLEMEIVLYSDLTLFDGDQHTGKSQETYGYISGTASGHLDKNLDDLVLPAAFENYDPDKKRCGILDESLVPRWKAEDFDSVATAFLKKYYREALEKPMPIDTDELVKRMGLTKKICSLTGTGAVFGRIYFRDDMASVYEEGFEDKTIPVHAGTIIVDPDSRFLRNVGAENNTVVHECVHWEYHRPAFELERMMDSELSQIACCVSGGILGQDAWTKSHIVEWQANRLAPCIQMPKAMFERKAAEFLQKFAEECGADDVIDIMEPTIDALASFFDVSRMAAKIRMCQLGYEEARGTFIWLDGHYVPAHAWKRGYLEENQTFTINSEQLGLQMYGSYVLHRDERRFGLVYVESHLVVNSPRYVQSDGFGGLALTDYARSHMDECAIVFEMTIAGKQDGNYASFCYLNRDQDADVTMEFKYHHGLENEKDDGKKIAAIDKSLCEQKRLYEKMPRNFVGMMKTMREESEMTLDKIAEETYLSKRTVQRLFTGENKDAKKLVLVLLSMQTPPLVSDAIMKTGGYALSPAEEDTLYLNLALMNCWNYAMERIWGFFNEHNIKFD